MPDRRQRSGPAVDEAHLASGIWHLASGIWHQSLLSPRVVTAHDRAGRVVPAVVRRCLGRWVKRRDALPAGGHGSLDPEINPKDFLPRSLRSRRSTVSGCSGLTSIPVQPVIRRGGSLPEVFSSTPVPGDSGRLGQDLAAGWCRVVRARPARETKQQPLLITTTRCATSTPRCAPEIGAVRGTDRGQPSRIRRHDLRGTWTKRPPAAR